MKLQVLKEKLPLHTKAICQIMPQAFDAYIMNTPNPEHLSAAQKSTNNGLLTSPIYMIRVRSP